LTVYIFYTNITIGYTVVRLPGGARMIVVKGVVRLGPSYTREFIGQAKSLDAAKQGEVTNVEIVDDLEQPNFIPFREGVVLEVCEVEIGE